jgi:adenylate kinase family enzyme
MIEREMQKVEVKLTGIIKKIENNKELRQDGGINRNEFQNRMKKLQEEKSPLVETQKRLKKAFKEYFEIEAQQKILEILEKITSNLDDLFTDRKKCKELLNLLIEEIVIFSDLDNDTVLP